jgi:hypothetical protein
MFLYFVECNYLKVKWNNAVMVAQLAAACPRTDATDATARVGAKLMVTCPRHPAQQDVGPNPAGK